MKRKDLEMKYILLSLLLGLLIHEFLSEGQQLSDYLWDETENERQAALDSVFVKAISNVTLDPVEFGAYLVQDAIYLYSVKKCMEVAARRSNEETVKAFFETYALKRYTSLYTNALKDWHIQDPSTIILGSGCESYVNHLQNVAETMDPDYFVIANIPCEKLWPWIGEQIGVGTKDFGIYNKWVKENWNPDINVHLEFEKVANDAFTNGRITKEKALEVYRKSMVGEVEFFNSVYSSTGQKQEAHDEL